MGSAARKPQRGVQEGRGQEGASDGCAGGDQEGASESCVGGWGQEGASEGCAGGWRPGRGEVRWWVEAWGVLPGGILRQEVWKQQVSFCMLWS